MQRSLKFCGDVLVSTEDRLRSVARRGCLVGHVKIPRQKINANTVDSDENIDRLLAQAADIMARPDEYAPVTTEVADEALV